jgi:tRNA (uracil-5-)-methyltransferase TRM9
VWALEQEGSRRGWAAGGVQDVMVPWVTPGGGGEGKGTVVQRYYHLYREGELEGDVGRAGGVVVESGYEKDNWWVVARRRVDGDG